jgi:hypothetical protein
MSPLHLPLYYIYFAVIGRPLEARRAPLTLKSVSIGVSIKYQYQLGLRYVTQIFLTKFQLKEIKSEDGILGKLIIIPTVFVHFKNNSFILSKYW